MRRTYLVIATVLIALLGLTGPALAADPPDNGSPLSTVEIEGDGDALANGVYCSAWGNPLPQVGGNSLHYGGKVICNIVGSIWMKVQLYQIINGEPYPDVAKEKSGVGSSLGGTWTIPCLGDTPTQWTIALWATFNGVAFTPYPGVAAPKTLPCE